VYRSGAIKITSLKDNTAQVVNEQRIKNYISEDSYKEYIDIIQVVTPEEFIKEQMQETAESVFE
jgi:predicted nucleic acid-binding protein